MRMFAIASLCLAVPSLVLAQEPSLPEALASTSALRQFQRAQDSQWIVRWHPATGTPSTMYGTGLRLAGWRENSLAEARRHARLLMTQQAELLGLGTSDFAEVIGARMGRTWSLTYDQSFRGIPALEGRVDIRIHMTGVVAMMGSRAWPIPANFDVTPAITDNVAQAIAWHALRTEPVNVGNAAAPRLVIWGDVASPVVSSIHLAWEVSVNNVGANGEGVYGRYIIDAKTGDVLDYQNDKHDCGQAGCSTDVAAERPVGPTVSITTEPSLLPTVTTVTLMAWTRTGDDAFDPLVNEPLRGIVVNVPGIGSRTTDANGEFDIDINSPVTITINGLDGTHFQPINGPSQPTGSVTVNPGVNATIQLLTAGATSAQAAHTTAAYWVDRSNEWARSILGNSSQMNGASNIGVEVNISNTCNATYGGNNTRFYQAGGGCSNTAFSTVIAHEWGHGLDDRYGGIANSNAEGLSEGWGDIIGLYQTDSPILGSGFQSPGVGLRNGNNNRVWPYSTTISPHGAGEVWMGFAWRLRDNLRASLGTQGAILVSNEIVMGSIVADATTRVNAVLEVFIADDDDGNLLNGVPHYAELSAAAITKGIPYPEIQLVSITHSPLGPTSQRLVPREVFAIVTPISGSINGLTMVFDAGSGSVVRNMFPTTTPDQFLAMLPGLSAGSVSYHIEVAHSTGATVRLPESGEFSYPIDSGTFGGFYYDGFETGATGWTSAQVATQNDWQVGNPAGKSGVSSGVAWNDPQNAAAGNNCYGNDLGNVIGGSNWNGRYQPNVENYLHSPVIDCTGKFGVRLRFRRWLQVQEASSDQATIYVNGQQVWQNPQNGHLLDQSWQTVEYTIPMADNNPAVTIEWRMKSNGSMHLGGWNIDEVQLGETIVPTVDAELTFLPEQAVQGTPMTLTVTTPGGSRPYILALGDAIGPTIVPGFPIVFVGGAFDIVGGTTNVGGTSVFTITAPTVPSAVGIRFYSQVLTVDAGFTQFVTSNRHVNLITQ